MPKTTVDPKRTGVKAVRMEWVEPPLECIDGLWFGPPGAMIHREYGKSPPDGIGYLICCPGCGQVGGARDGASWRPVNGVSYVGSVMLDAGPGDLNDVTTLSLEPSILKSCCGWHGYLRNGVFESC